MLPRNDDNSTSQVPLPFPVNFYGETFDHAWVNNNGNITFDGPLSTYTPFGLTGTSASIIAPFFADVDTRGTGSGVVAYGWGDTVYQGHRAFCVNWVDVGYYSAHTDKLNSFQLLLVEREDSEPGDFDIVFNYDKVQWETGDASGGSGGLGGSPARAGFSNGTAQPGTFYEMSGSGVSSAFLDSSPTGLAGTTTDSTQTGRHVWRVRDGAAPQTEYVALGDSFQSGEGTYNYYSGTDVDENKCHRSPDAYPAQLVSQGAVDLDLSFWACSGAVIDDLPTSSVSKTGVPWNDPMRGAFDETTPVAGELQSAMDRLSPATKLVTVGIGGNDMKFATILQDCIKHTAGDKANPFSHTSCETKYGTEVDDRLDYLVARGRWTSVFDDIRSRAPFARVVVLGYPRFFVEGGADAGWYTTSCSGVRVADQRWINDEIEDVDEAIENAARSRGMQYVDIYNTPDGFELCSDSDEQFMNGIEPRVGNPPTKIESYHPTAFGHSLITDTLRGELDGVGPGRTAMVGPGETLTFTQETLEGLKAFFSNIWPGSDVVMTLRSPSGRTITRGVTGADLEHRLGPTSETWAIEDPEPGSWTIELYGARVAAQGEKTRLDVYQAPRPNEKPTAAMTLGVDGRTVSVDASASSDADGRVTEYLWEFGDGTIKTGPKITHTYREPGEYLVTLAVRDDVGGEDFVSANHTVIVPKYIFSGFSAPVQDPPATNTVNAGRSIPLKFSLDGDYGLGVVEGGRPTVQRVDCVTHDDIGSPTRAAAAGGSVLTYDTGTGRYHYPWKTEKAWAGSCQNLLLTLDDGSTHSALFRFR